jgi:hypothetical protein
MRHVFSILMFSLLLFFNMAVVATASEKKMVLVVAADAGHLKFNRSEIRQLFFAGAIIKDGVQFEAVINDSDPLLYEVFLQKIIFMSARAYERKLISRVFRKGGRRVVLASGLESLENDLVANPGWVSFMWEEHARSLPGITVIGQLWHGSVN